LTVPVDPVLDFVGCPCDGVEIRSLHQARSERNYNGVKWFKNEVKCVRRTLSNILVPDK